jgi:hypothetical protein
MGNLEGRAVREVLITDTVAAADRNWPQLRVVSIAPLIAGVLERLPADGSIGDLYRGSARERIVAGRRGTNVTGTLSQSLDQPERFRLCAPLNPDDPSTYRGGGADGYADYPTLAQRRGQ